MKTIYLVRHGEAENNIRTGKYYLGRNSALTTLGHQQAQVVAERAAHLPIEALIASTMLRAQQTAEHISKRIGKTIEPSDLFIERRDPASFIGTLWHDPETQRLYKEWAQTLFNEKERVLDGENFIDITERAKAALKYLEERPESNILIVTHGFFLRTLVAYMLLQDTITPLQFKLLSEGLRTTNTGLTVFRYTTEPAEEEAAWTMRIWNDHSHLADS